jgi:hypothetical protein
MNNEQTTPTQQNEDTNIKDQLPPRSERKITLVSKDGSFISCMINPTLMWIKQKYKSTLRKQQIINSKLSGIEERRKSLHNELKAASAANDPKAVEIEKLLDELYTQVGELEDQNKKMNFDLAAWSVHFPVVKDKQIKKEDIDWDSCDEVEINEAQRFFLLP